MTNLKTYKNISFSLIVIYTWILYNFFDYYNALQYSFSKLTLYFNFLNGMFLSVGLGIFLILMRTTFFRKKNIPKIKNNFFYIFAGIFNLNLIIIWLISVIMKIIDFDLGIIYLIFMNLIISIFIFADIYLIKEKTN